VLALLWAAFALCAEAIPVVVSKLSMSVKLVNKVAKAIFKLLEFDMQFFSLF